MRKGRADRIYNFNIFPAGPGFKTCLFALLLVFPACAKLGGGMYLGLTDLFSAGAAGPLPASTPAAGFRIGGNVSGLSGKDLTLSLNGGESLRINGNGAFAFTGTAANGQAYSVSILTQPVSPIQTCVVTSGSGTVGGSDVSNVVVTCTETIAPEILAAAVPDATTVRVFFSESVTGVTAAAFKITEAPAGDCADNSLFTTSAQTGDFAITSITAGDGYYDINLNSAQTLNKTYTVVANRLVVADLAVPANGLGCPSSANFTGQAPLAMSHAACADTTSVILTFSKPVLAGVNADGSVECDNAAACATRYKINGAAAPGAVTSVRALNGINCNGAPADGSGTRFCLTHTNAQNGGHYGVTASNATNGDGFDDAGCGGPQCALRNAADSQSMAAAPSDRYAFVGCGSAPSTPGGGPATSDPFGDGTAVGHLTAYRGKIYIGPNQAGSGLNRFNPDGSSPGGVTLKISRDGSMFNTGLQDTSLGHAGCTLNSNDTVLGCGPDNEDGRAFIRAVTMGAADYLFLSGTRSGGDYRYLYFTDDVDDILNANFIRLNGALSDNENYSSRTMAAMDNRLYIGFATGLLPLSPGLSRVSFNTGDADFCAVNADCDADDGDEGTALALGYMSFFGRKDPGQPDRNHSALINIDAMIVFNGLLYMANGGHHEVGHNGTIIRSNNNNPGACTASGVCPDWTEIGPRANAAWHNTNARFSLEIAKTGSLIPADLAFPAFAEFNGNLYVIRNTCTTAGTVGFDVAAHTTAGCNDGTVANREAQLWKCVPATSGAATSCEAGDWSLVASNGASGVTNLGDANNRVASMLMVNGGRLYIGFDNVNGVELWRTRSGVTNPAVEGDFEQIGGDGFGNPAQTRQIYSSVSVAYGPWNYLYISAGDGGVPISAYVQRE